MVDRKRKVTQEHIASDLGVSKFTVSRAISGKPGISETMRVQVFATARKLGYLLRSVAEHPEQTAAKKGLIVMLMPQASAADTDFWPRVFAGAQAGTRNRDTNLILAVVSDAEEASLRLPSHLDNIPVAGFLCIDRLSPGYLSFVRQTGHPVVCIDSYFPDLQLDGVMADDSDGARLAVKHLIEMGHEKIGFVGNHHWAYSFHQRWIGYRATMEQAGLPISPPWTLLRDGSKEPWDLTWLRERLRAREMPTAWFCTNDVTAFALMKVLGEMGLRIPNDVSVVGFDDVARAATETTPLTTVHFPKEVMGRRCVERLYQRMEYPDDPVDLTLISTRLVIRDSVKTLKGRNSVRAITQGANVQ